ncbi:DUF1059 domain-containing protein [Acidianus brierleyi]|uniref:Small metal-binding protein n=1 Tax=Acidianus brierleyi TaxID=41673 RepID=A0A2U9ICA1_9CREN|nr:DUF1059 domain-containing protein [Acidianus brierleyi]AWR93648.1 DUF1059 domain-containing protein [Acidianus brierleyi]
MKYSFKCSDIGQKCGLEIYGAQSEEELLQELSIHARIEHKMNSIPDEVLNAIKSNIKKS